MDVCQPLLGKCRSIRPLVSAEHTSETPPCPSSYTLTTRLGWVVSITFCRAFSPHRSDTPEQKQFDFRRFELPSDCAIDMTTNSLLQSCTDNRGIASRRLQFKPPMWACPESDSSGRSTVGPIHWILRSHLRSRSDETVRRDFASSGSLLRSHRPEQRTEWRQSSICRQTDGKQGAFSGHGRERKNQMSWAWQPKANGILRTDVFKLLQGTQRRFHKAILFLIPLDGRNQITGIAESLAQ